MHNYVCIMIRYIPSARKEESGDKVAASTRFRGWADLSLLLQQSVSVGNTLVQSAIESRITL